MIASVISTEKSPSINVTSNPSNSDKEMPVESENQVEEKKVFIESDAGDGSKREDHYLTGSKLVICILAIFLCLFLVALDQTIVVTLLSTVGNKFDAFDQVGWLSSGFLLSMAVFVVTWGKLSITFGRKYTMIAAIIIFEAGSLMCALANDMDVLIGARVFAGVGGGGIQLLVFILITEIAPLEKRPLVTAVMGCTFAIASVLGPLIGGAFTSKVTWRWCFYINLPIGGLALGFFYFAFNPPKPKGSIIQKLKMIDYTGTLLLVAGLVIFLLALTFGSGDEYAWNSGAVISCFVIGGFLVILFGIWNFKFSRNPIISPEVVLTFPVDASSVLIFSMFGFFISTVLYVSIYFQVIHGADAWHSGVHLLPYIIPVVLASILSGIFIQKSTHVKPFAVAGGILSPIGVGILCLLDTNSSMARQIGLLILVGVSCGIQMQPAILSAQIAAPKSPGSTINATTMINFSRSLGGAIGGTLADAVYTSAFVNHYRKELVKISNSTILRETENIDVHSLTTSAALLKSLSPVTQDFIKSIVMIAIRNVFYMSLGFAGLNLIASIFISNKRLPKKSQGASQSEIAKAEMKKTNGNEEGTFKENEVFSNISGIEKDNTK